MKSPYKNLTYLNNNTYFFFECLLLYYLLGILLALSHLAPCERGEESRNKEHGTPECPEQTVC